MTPEEAQAVERLQALGFDKLSAFQALKAFDGNEELAANFLFESAMADDDAGLNAAIMQSAAADNAAQA